MVSVEEMQQGMVNVAVESWRLTASLTKLVSRLDAQEQGRYASRLRWFAKVTERALLSAGLRIVSYEGMPYDSGLPATPINLDDYPADSELIIGQTLEPTILDAQGNIVRVGTILVKPA